MRAQDDCIYQEGVRRRRRLQAATPPVYSAATATADGRMQPAHGHGWGGAVNDYICGGGDAYLEWVAQASVREALHVPSDSFFYDSDGGGPYRGSEPNLMPFYQSLAADPSSDLRVLICA